LYHDDVQVLSLMPSLRLCTRLPEFATSSKVSNLVDRQTDTCCIIDVGMHLRGRRCEEVECEEVEMYAAAHTSPSEVASLD
jgi:hypothetical protein